jgi:hypothetical protein
MNLVEVSERTKGGDNTINMDRGPVFVGGLSRCGKTLMCSLLAPHPNIAMPLKESNLWTYFYGQYGDLSQGRNFERCLAAMLRYKGVQLLSPDPDRIREAFWQGEPTYARLFALFHAHYAEQLGKPRWGVQSVCVEYYTESIFAAYPTVKMIHMIRDPRDRFAAQIIHGYARGGRRKVAIATANWLYSVGLAKRNQKRYPHRYKVVCYEALASQPKETIRDVCAFLDEDYTPAMFATKDSPRYRNEDVSTAFIGCFHQMMSRREIAFMQAYAKRDMLAYNYELEPVRFSPAAYLLFHFIDQPINLVCMIAWRLWRELQLRFPAQMGSTLPPHLMSS